MTTATDAAVAQRPVSGAGAAFWVIAWLQLLALFAQAVFAGLFMNGVHAMRAAHGAGAMAVLGLAIAQLVAALLMRRPVGAVAASVGMLLAVVGQAVAGGAHVLSVHVPLALLLFGGALWCATSAWRRAGSDSVRACRPARPITRAFGPTLRQR